MGRQLTAARVSMKHRRNIAVTAAIAVAAATAAGIGVQAGQASPSRSARSATVHAAKGIHKIKHVIVIMMENRSFDTFFGTFPGADGYPAHVCLPDPDNGGCDKPYADHADSNLDHPHSEEAFPVDKAGGKMNGFVSES